MLRLPGSHGRLRSRIYALAMVNGESVTDEGEILITVNVDAPTIGRIENEPDFDPDYWVKLAPAGSDDLAVVKAASTGAKA